MPGVPSWSYNGDGGFYVHDVLLPLLFHNEHAKKFTVLQWPYINFSLHEKILRCVKKYYLFMYT